ncbi:sensor histidine kinase [Methylomagnum ishizawai]|uniref:sensor histidine kinase n=1 Tax=Methylomagnum ishizawai TaxID=1760988 RepID=UPI001C3424E7|nr:sensor histidine kinase [Methylomagnum ishizawai]BBL74094.1 hypothetical protein MishRS11D_11920 [Methylomagnum ishizawai]
MSIARLLLIAFLLLNFLASAVLAGLSFFASRQALATEIGLNLGQDAAMLMEQIDMLLFERLQNVHSWSHLDIMQEARLGDVDKRLAGFLAEIRSGYGDAYREVFYADPAGKVVASSDPGRIGQPLPERAVWVETRVPIGEVFLRLPTADALDLWVRAPVDNRYGPGLIGDLYGAVDLAGIFRLFDQTERSEPGGKRVALLDREGRLIAASESLRQGGLLLGDAFAAWRGDGATQFVHGAAQAGQGPVLAGYAVSRGYQGYPGVGWSLLVFQSTEQAFRPIRNLLWLFSLAFLLTGLLAGVAARIVARRIARPLVALGDWARSGVKAAPPVRPDGGTREVRELGAAFGQMVDNLEQSRQQVIHAAKLAVVGEMAAIMAHEVRTPLGVLHTSAQMLRREADLSPEGREMTRFILEESSRLERLVSTLLECARPRPPKRQPQDVHAILRRVAELLAAQARKKSIAFEWRLAAQDAVVPCDEELLMQVFLNLILNAIQILSPGSRIGLRSQGDARKLVVEVIDDGPGVPVEYRQRVFDPFFTQREGGIGLGLAVTRQIVESHGGGIEVAESAWGGAAFAVGLPRGAEAS